MKFIQTILVVTLALVFISCRENTQTPISDIKDLKIVENDKSIYSTDTLKLTALVTYDDNTTADVSKLVSWSSSDSSVIKGRSSQFQAGISNGGDANITISYDGADGNLVGSNSCKVDVIKLKSFTISMTGADANATGTYPLIATGIFEDNSSKVIVKNIVWNTNNSAVVTGEGSDTEIEVKAGDTNITATMFKDANITQEIIYSVK